MDSARAVTQQLLQAIVVQYGSRLTAAQRTDIELYLERIDHATRGLRSYPLSHADEPVQMAPPYLAEERDGCLP